MRLPVLLVALLLAGCAAPAVPTPAPPARSTYADTVTLPSRGDFEVNLQMAAGDAIEVALNASQPMSWDVHSHPQGELVEWRKGDGRVGNATFSAPEDGIYSVYVESTSPSTNVVKISIAGAFRLIE